MIELAPLQEMVCDWLAQLPGISCGLHVFCRSNYDLMANI